MSAHKEDTCPCEFCQIKRLRDALTRTVNNFASLLERKPVRDAAETIAEAHRALRLSE